MSEEVRSQLCAIGWSGSLEVRSELGVGMSGELSGSCVEQLRSELQEIRRTERLAR